MALRKPSTTKAASASTESKKDVHLQEFSQPFNDYVGRVIGANYLGIGINVYYDKEKKAYLPKNKNNYTIGKGGDGLSDYLSNVASNLSTKPYTDEEIKVEAVKNKEGNPVISTEKISDFVNYISELSDDDYTEFLLPKKDRTNLELKSNFLNVGLVNVSVGDLTIYSNSLIVKIDKESGDLIAEVQAPQEKGKDDKYYSIVTYSKDIRSKMNELATKLVNDFAGLTA